MTGQAQTGSRIMGSPTMSLMAVFSMISWLYTVEDADGFFRRSAGAV